MELVFTTVLVGYFVLFIGIALLYRSYLLYKNTGINALMQTPADRTLKWLAIVFRIQLAAAVALVIDRVSGNNVLSAYRFEWLPELLGGSIGSLLLLGSFITTVIAQQQMRTSWRIEIDRENDARLITSGLFRYSRNPIFLALRVSYFALFLMIPCPASLAILIVGDIAFQRQVKKEESYLKQAYGREYTDYCSQVRRWL